MAALSVIVTRALLVVILLAVPHTTLVSAADEDPLQDFCVALSSTEQQELLDMLTDNGLPCKPDASMHNFCTALNSTEQQKLQAMLTINGVPCKPVAKVKSSDFTSSQLRNAANFVGDLGAAVNLATPSSFGALNTQGLSIARIDFNPNGLNPPHVHPRATEVLYLVEGTLLVGFVSTTNNSFFYDTIYAGDLFVFPRGLVHFQLNTDQSKTAYALSALNSENPGLSQVAVALFAAKPPLPEQVLEDTLEVSKKEVRRLIASVKKTLS